MAAGCFALLALVPNLRAQEATTHERIGVSQDWTQRQIVFTKDGLAKHPEVIDREPRVLHQAMQRWQIPDWGTFHAVSLPTVAEKKRPVHERFHRDWSVTLLGGTMRKNQFPAKYSYDAAAPPDCVKDYAVFGLAFVSSLGGNANFIGFNNLYSNPAGTGFCTGTGSTGDGPSVRFAYDVTTLPNGKVMTSPVISEDGMKIAFVESQPGPSPAASFHVLTWTAGQGTLTAAAVPTAMTTLALSTTADDIYSSPWVDYTNDIAYVATDDGEIWAITPVFRGTPALAGAPWPVTPHTGYHLTAPVLDSVHGLLMVGCFDGFLYQINVATGAVTGFQIGVTAGDGSGIAGPPIVDITNGTTFAVTGNVVSTINGNATIPGAALVQFDTTTLAPMAVGSIGIGGTTGDKLRLYQPALNNDYFNDPTTGKITLCGTGIIDTSPWQYSFGFTAPATMDTIGTPNQLSTSTTDVCTGWTEFYNLPLNVDFLFFGLSGDCTLLGGINASTTGCVVALNSDSAIPTATSAVNAGPSGIIVDNYSNDYEASSIYFGSVFADTVYKLTQNGLN